MNSTYNQALNDVSRAAWPGTDPTAISHGGASDTTVGAGVAIGVLILVLIITWLFYMAVAYCIYWFFTKAFPQTNYNYWIILLILIIAGLVVGLISNLTYRFFICPEMAQKM